MPQASFSYRIVTFLIVCASLWFFSCMTAYAEEGDLKSEKESTLINPWLDAQNNDPLSRYKELGEHKKPSATQLKVGDTTYKRRDVVYDFIKTSLNYSLGFEKSSDPSYGATIFALEATRPPPQSVDSFGRRGVINKWSNKLIIVDLGWPKEGHEAGLLDEQYEWVKSQINIISPQIERVTGVKLVINAKPSKDSNLLTSGVIRIALGDTGQKVNYFRPKQGDAHNKFEFTFMQNFGAVRFAPQEESQVSGMLVPTGGNDVDSALCVIWPFKEATLLKNLTTECLVRALGLTDVSSNPNSILSAWNSKYDNHKNINANLVPTASLSHNEFFEKKSGAFSYIPEKMNTAASGLSLYDLLLLKILYCKDISAGMDANQLVFTLNQTEQCFLQTNSKGE